MVRLGTGVSYVLIYSSLLVKLVFLISLNTGVYLPAMYQALLFFFCILVQTVITTQWNILKESVSDSLSRSQSSVHQRSYLKETYHDGRFMLD